MLMAVALECPLDTGRIRKVIECWEIARHRGKLKNSTAVSCTHQFGVNEEKIGIEERSFLQAFIVPKFDQAARASASLRW